MCWSPFQLPLRLNPAAGAVFAFFLCIFGAPFDVLDPVFFFLFSLACVVIGVAFK